MDSFGETPVPVSSIARRRLLSSLLGKSLAVVAAFLKATLAMSVWPIM